MDCEEDKTYECLSCGHVFLYRDADPHCMLRGRRTGPWGDCYPSEYESRCPSCGSRQMEPAAVMCSMCEQRPCICDPCDLAEEFSISNFADTLMGLMDNG